MDTERAQTLIEQFESAGQGQVFRFWGDLSDREKEALLADAELIDLNEIEALVNEHLRGAGKATTDFGGLEPAPFERHPSRGGDSTVWEAMRDLGEAAIRAGKVAAFTVAGGQGTRLGYDGPKGTFPVTPVRQHPLFQVFAEKILAAGQRYGQSIPWFIMTSPLNHSATVEAFHDADYFGLSKDQVHFFPQGRIAAVDNEGKILLASKSSVAMTPDGHGGSLRALVRSGAVDQMKAAGVEVISYFQVDNPLVQCIDPVFVGFHLKKQSEMSSKMIPKAYPGEKVGHFCAEGDHMVVIEYSDLPQSMQEEQDANGDLRFLAGSIAIHILDIDFVERVGGGAEGAALPFHRANKKIATVDENGLPSIPDTPNGVKFEMFVFDALPLSRNPVVIETLREDDFSPVKNAEGVDSPATAEADQIRQWTRWLQAAGVPLETDETGLPPLKFEVSPLFADNEETFVERWNKLDPAPPIEDGLVLA